MAKPNLDCCASGADFVRAVEKSPKAVKVRWSGDHVTVWGPDGRLTLVNSKYEYPPYVRRKIRRAIVAVGLAAFPLLAIWLVIAL